MSVDAIIPLKQLEWQIPEVRKLQAILHNVQLQQDHVRSIERLVFALRVLDGRSEGASLRDLAQGIFGSSDWPGDGESIKSRVRRFVALAIKLKKAGPAGVLGEVL